MLSYCATRVDCFHLHCSQVNRHSKSWAALSMSISPSSEFGKSAGIPRLQNQFKSKRGSRTWEYAHGALSLHDQRRFALRDGVPS